jgi:hypothetical protein
MGTSSLRILNRNQENTIVMGVNLLSGRAGDQSSYQSEVAGIFSIIVFVSLVVEYCDIAEGIIEVACNGIEALRSI